MEHYDYIKSILDNHNIIGWDADETIINGLHSDLFCKYIKEHPHKKHIIITFREALWAEKIFDEFEDRDMVGLFSGLVPSQYDWWQAREYIKRWGEAPSGEDEAEFAEWIIENNNNYIQFKANTCLNIGATILVDDKPEDTIAYCEVNKIHFLNSITLDYNTWEV